MSTGAPVALTNDTIANNLGGLQPAVVAASSVSTTIDQVTIAGNSPAGSASTGADDVYAPGATILDSALDASCASPVADGGHNVSLAGGGCPGKPVGPWQFDLGPLQDNGGPTETMLPLARSVLIDEVPSSGAGCRATDQRAVPRPQGVACDAGAVEVRAPVVAVSSGRLKFGRTRLRHIRRKTLRVTYVSGEDLLAVGKVRISGRNARDFRVVANRCRGKSLGQRKSCTLAISFRPPKRGIRRARVIITLAGPGEPATVWLVGTGVE